MGILPTIKRFIPKKIFRAIQPAYHFLMAFMAALFYRFPSESLVVIGITGTTGKTTSVYLAARALAAAGIKTGYTSTAMFNDGRKEWPNDKKMTMVGRFFTQKILRTMARNGCRAAVIETSSEGIRQFRHRFINYDIVVFTGLYEEHIDSHGSFENYKQAKAELFRHLGRGRAKYTDNNGRVARPESGLGKLGYNRVKKTIVANGDDPHSAYFLGFSAQEKIAYSFEAKRAVAGRLVSYSRVKAGADGLRFSVGGETVSLKLLGAFNAQNAMNAICVGLALGKDVKALKPGLESIAFVPGRLEKIDAGQPYIAIVDYAFEPKALEKLYETLALIPHGRIIHVLGSAGGGRDISRRPKLGAIAGQKADHVIVTNEDPYDDDPEIIIDQVALGAEQSGKKPGENLYKIMDRREAIKKAVSLAGPGDILVLTGKGSEKAICVANGRKLPWDDREALAQAIAESLASTARPSP